MQGLVATGHPWHAVHPSLTPIPLAGLLTTLLLIRFVLKLPVGIAALGAAIPLGTVFATLEDAWGLTLTLSTWILAALALAGPIRRSRGAFGRNSSD
jgi:hypothetical protein